MLPLVVTACVSMMMMIMMADDVVLAVDLVPTAEAGVVVVAVGVDP